MDVLVQHRALVAGIIGVAERAVDGNLDSAAVRTTVPRSRCGHHACARRIELDVALTGEEVAVGLDAVTDALESVSYRQAPWLIEVCFLGKCPAEQQKGAAISRNPLIILAPRRGLEPLT